MATETCRARPVGGFAAWDLVMPLFLFIVGTAMPFSFAGASVRNPYGRFISR